MKWLGSVKSLGCVLSITLLWSTLSGVHAQTLSATLYPQDVDINGIAGKTKTAPQDDAVLEQAPHALDFEFPERVRLVKLTLRNAKHDWVDINFRYDPQLEQDFSWNLPALNAAPYYTAEWAVLAANDQLVRGSFSFSFGPDAKPPSIEKEADELLLQLRYGDPTVRTVRPPRTQIIINQDQPAFDPPFTINLDESVSVDPQ